uniref:Uncharacterized protein n=1 Tax=Xenopus tropicalis TaxID=8364 RepID=A0A1B8Y1X0_XENTR
MYAREIPALGTAEVGQHCPTGLNVRDTQSCPDWELEARRSRLTWRVSHCLIGKGAPYLHDSTATGGRALPLAPTKAPPSARDSELNGLLGNAGSRTERREYSRQKEVGAVTS